MTVLPEQIARTTLTLEETQISLMRSGRGRPLLFLHGSESPVWSPFFERLATRFDTIVPDHPGFGRSPTPPWLDTIADLATFYRALLDELDLRDVLICGNDLGGWIAADLALRDPRRLRGLVLLAPAGLPLDVDGIDTFLCSPAELREASYVDPARAPLLDADAQALQPKDALMTARLAWTPRFYDPYLVKWLHRLRTPALVVWGRGDRIFPPQQVAAFERTLPHARSAVVDDAGHLPHLEQPDAVSAAIFSFAEDLR